MSCDLQESLQTIVCGLDEALVSSHHDIILSEFTLARKPLSVNDKTNVTAPIVSNNRHRVFWSDEGIAEYQSIVVPHLSRLQNMWLHPSSQSSMSLFLDLTSDVLSTCDKSTNKTLPLSLNCTSRNKAARTKGVSNLEEDKGALETRLLLASSYVNIMKISKKIGQ